MKNNDVGVYQMKNKMWAFRFVIKVNGKSENHKGTTDSQGNKLKTKRAAIAARNEAIERAKDTSSLSVPIVRKTFEEVYNEYVEKGRGGKAFQTKRKQDSIWKNHLKDRFGDRFVDDISVAEIGDYLTELYYLDDYSFRYVESFLKMFYLIFGQAYSRNYLNVDCYNKLCLNKGTKIRMPKLKTDDDTDIVAFSAEELAILDDYFRGTNAETAYILGRYCGLRINETYGLMWENVDLEKGTISICQQMQYQEGVIKLVQLKTKNARRTIIMCDKLKAYFHELYAATERAKEMLGDVREQRKKILEDSKGKMISSLQLVNALPDGKIQTVNSMKFHTKKIRETLGIEFKYHYLRHTYGTFMADMNTPSHLLCSQMGHANIQVTQRYYIASSKTGEDILKYNLNLL